MDVLAEIRQKLLDGKQPVDLVREGYAKSSVYHMAKKVRDAHLGMPSLPVSDELTELRRRKEVIKLEKEIAELEAAKQKLPDRVAALESEVVALRSLIRNAVDTALFIAMVYANRPDEGKLSGDEVRKYSDGWAEKQIEKRNV